MTAMCQGARVPALILKIGRYPLHSAHVDVSASAGRAAAVVIERFIMIS
jgi:hypothetical protein